MTEPAPGFHGPWFHWPLRVYYENTDAGGVVYHGQYVNFFERARTEWLRACGFDQTALADEAGVLFAVSAMDLRYRKPARLDDLVIAEVGLVERRRASMILAQRLVRGDDLLVTSTVTIACVSRDSFRPVTLPSVLVDALGSRLVPAP